jgi:predicted transcriptional regulator of viral defense system
MRDRGAHGLTPWFIWYKIPADLPKCWYFVPSDGGTAVARRDKIEEAREAFRRHGGILKMSEAIRAGIHRRTLYAMRDAGSIERLGRGLYRLSDLPPLGNPDLVSVSRRIPRGVICLVSALAYHEITTQIPHQVLLALPRGTEPPRIDHPPIWVFWYTGAAFTEGIDTHVLDNTSVRIYSPEKTLADCFKYRNKIGLDTVVEALRLYRQRMRLKADDLLRFARICRVEKVMRPYLEAML